jgi:hypothetical protein
MQVPLCHCATYAMYHLRVVHCYQPKKKTRKSGSIKEYLSIRRFFAGDTAEESFTRQGTIAHEHEPRLSNLANSLPFEAQRLANQLQRLSFLGEEGRTLPFSIRTTTTSTTVSSVSGGSTTSVDINGWH